MNIYQLSSPTTPIKVTLTNLGATILSIKTPDKNETLAEITTCCENPADLIRSTAYFGATCGRVANRIKHGKFSLNGKNYQTAINNGPNSNHGGDAPFNSRLWNTKSITQNSVTFSLISPHGEGGYPGTLKIHAKYTLEYNGDLNIQYQATTDRDTIINLTNHTYWNLSGDPTTTIHDHQIQIPADSYLPIDPDHLVTGEILPVQNTLFDLRKPKELNPFLNDPTLSNPVTLGFDNTFPIPGTGLRTAATLHHPASGRTVEILTDQPAIHLYTGGYLSDIVPGRNNTKIQPYSGLALESQKYPDAPNHPTFPSITLKKADTYQHKILFKFNHS